MTIMLMIAALALSGGLSPRSKRSSPKCRAISLKVSLNAGENFRQEVGDLTFRIQAANGTGLCKGWFFSLEDAKGNDFIYPVNPPLRFNASENLGCSYGLTARQSLETQRRLRFVLTEREYLRLDPLVTNALWPADSPDPDGAAERYAKALSKVQTGLIQLKALRFDISPDGLIRSATFRVKLIAPTSFDFGPALKPYSTACPAAPSQ